MAFCVSLERERLALIRVCRRFDGGTFNTILQSIAVRSRYRFVMHDDEPWFEEQTKILFRQ